MAFVVAFLVNAGLSFALSLALAALLGPAGFARFAIGLAAAIVTHTLLFEWLRLSTTRFHSARVAAETPALRRTLGRAYLGIGVALSAATAGILALGLDLGVSPALLAATAGCGLAYGLCEYRLALARALFHERIYVAITMLRALGGALLASGAAWLTADPALALAGAAAGALLPVLVFHRALADPAAAAAESDPARLRAFAGYGLPLVAAGTLYQLLPLLNRTLLAAQDGFVEAGYFSLASELVTRLFQNLGAGLDLLLFQLAVRAEELHGRAAAERQVSANAGMLAAIVIPAACGLWLAWPAFEAVFIPRAFQGRLGPIAASLIPALAAFALVQYGVAAAFQLRRRTGPVIVAAAVALAVDLGVTLAWPGRLGPQGFALAQLLATLAGLATLTGLALREGARFPWRDLALSAASAGLMIALLWPTRRLDMPPSGLLALQVAAGVAVYGGLAFALDVAGARGLLVRGRRASGLR